MKDNEQKLKITMFLHMAFPVIVDIVRTFLRSFGCDVKEEGLWLDLAFNIKSGQNELKFYLHNLLLEISTVDRDENPLRFDERLRDFDYFMNKTVNIIHSKLRILLRLLDQDDFDKAIENVCKDADQYERIRIWKVDGNKPS